MTRSRASYHLIPRSENQVDFSDAHEAGLDGSTEARTKWTYFLLGCAILLPWNALMNGTSFFLTRLVGSPFYATFGSYFSSVFMLAKFTSQLYCTFTSQQSSPSRRIFVTTNVAILLVMSLCISTFMQGTPSAFFLFVMFISASLAAVAGCMCTAVYAVASLFGVSFLQAVLSGHAAVAVAVSAVQLISSIISLWSSSPKLISAQVMVAESGADGAEELAARIFFSVSGVFLCVTLAAYAWLARQPFYKSLTKVLEQRGQVGDTDELTGLVADVYENPPTEDNSRIYSVLRQNWVFMLSIAYVFTVTLAIFPAITVRVQSVNTAIHPMLFTSIHFLVYNIGDLVGRYICSFPCMAVWSANKILVMSVLRTVFIPLILLCNVQRPATVTPVIDSDILYMVILLTMGYTNGYLVVTATVAASSLEHNPRLEGDRKNIDVVATLCGSFAIVGLTAGALCSFVVQAMV